MTREEIVKELKRAKAAYNYNAFAALTEAIEILTQKPEQKNDRKFIEIVATYPVICTYPEYEGKPYFSIRYEENGEKFDGFGTYKPEVLSEYIREYFMGEKKGKWIDARDHCGEFMCSNCHETNINNFYNYCPHCGAKMSEERN